MKRLGAILSEDGRQDDAKMELCWPTWRPRRPTWSILGAIFAHLSRLGMIFNEIMKIQKNIEKLMVFKGFWMVWELHLETFGGHVGLCWRIFALS